MRASRYAARQGHDAVCVGMQSPRRLLAPRGRQPSRQRTVMHRHHRACAWAPSIAEVAGAPVPGALRLIWRMPAYRCRYLAYLMADVLALALALALAK